MVMPFENVASPVMAIASADTSPKFTLPLRMLDPPTVREFEVPKTLETPLMRIESNVASQSQSVVQIGDASNRDRVPSGVTEIDVAVQTRCARYRERRDHQ